MTEQRPAVPSAQELPVEGKTVKALTLLSVKRTFDLFTGNHGQKVPLDEERCAVVHEDFSTKNYARIQPSFTALLGRCLLLN